ncbi:MAG: hypothetical protein AB7F09_04415 [Parvibaculaceae bacterium]
MLKSLGILWSRLVIPLKEPSLVTMGLVALMVVPLLTHTPGWSLAVASLIILWLILAMVIGWLKPELIAEKQRKRGLPPTGRLINEQYYIRSVLIVLIFYYIWAFRGDLVRVLA